MKVTIGSLFSAEGWLELESHESDLRGSRGIAIAGALMLFMGILNFKNTVIPPALLQTSNSCSLALVAGSSRATSSIFLYYMVLGPPNIQAI